MGLRRNVGFFEGLKYQGGGPMLAWMLHRVSGVGIVVFVSLHVVASFFMQQMGNPDWAIWVNTVYESWIFQIFVVFFVIFHALNGLRILALDLWPQFLEYQREALWVQMAVFTPVYGLTVLIVILRALSGS
jgi:succinate dehydrogenase / fumarate reductase, cytochrome b subunit